MFVLQGPDKHTLETMNNDTESIGNYLNDNVRYTRKLNLTLEIDEDEVDKVADQLVEKLGKTPGYTDSRAYYCKVARLIPGPTLERLANDAIECGKYPGKLFTYLTKKELKRISHLRGHDGA